MTEGAAPVTVLAPPTSGWTVETYAVHNEALRQADKTFHEERDRRYTEVAVEREKALQIKEKADDRALQLAREIQTYKDEKANELRSQIERERVTYATKDDLAAFNAKIEETLKPLIAYVSTQQGRSEQQIDQRTDQRWTFQQVLVLIGLAAGAIYFIFQNP